MKIKSVEIQACLYIAHARYSFDRSWPRFSRRNEGNVTKFMNFRGFPSLIELWNFERKSMATLDCAHARSFLPRCSLVFRQGGTEGGREGFFFFFWMCHGISNRPCFHALFDWLCFIIGLKGSFVRSNYFKIREWKIDEIEAIFTPRFPRPLLCLLVLIFKIFL